MSMSHEEYLRYLKSDEWKNKRDKRIDIDNDVCQMCGCRGTQLNKLQVHHMTYHNIGKENVYTDLVTLCDSCHRGVHQMMNRITDANGRKGWKDQLSYSRHVLEDER